VKPVSIDNASLDGAARRIGDRWTMRLVGALLEGDRTFTELADEVDGIAPNILTARLRALQAQALVVARPYERRPLRMRYALTEPGRRLGEAIASLAEWGAWRDGRPAARVHEACGSTLEPRLWCPTCDVAVDDDGDSPIWC
jgi:DNA-binding HxlR family transcriptional regulator